MGWHQSKNVPQQVKQEYESRIPTEWEKSLPPSLQIEINI